MKVREAVLVATAAGAEGFPPPGAPEVAILGRSNVGKSSLLNRLVGRRQLARTSSTPGKTRLVNFYRIVADGRTLLLVDLPGYGYARVSKAERAGWRRLVEGYLEGRTPLRAAVLLQDLRRDLSAQEEELLAWLAARRVPAILAVTKVDKLKPMRRGGRMRELAAQLARADLPVVATSAQTGEGMPALWRAIWAAGGAD